MRKQRGYILIVTLLMMVALVVAGMGAMMVATSDISLSGNQRTQVGATEASSTGINAGMATLCSNSFLTAYQFAGNKNYINTPPSSPQTGFYTGLYSSRLPTTNAGSNYAVGYFTPSSSLSTSNGGSGGFGAAVPPPIGSYGSSSAVNTWADLGNGKGLIYRIGPVIGVVGTSTKVECEQFVYYGLP